MRMERRETTIEDGPSGPYRIIEFVVVGGHAAVMQIAKHMNANGPVYFWQRSGAGFYWGADWDVTGEDARGNDIGETTFYLETDHGRTAEDVRGIRWLYRRARRAGALSE